jgi:hypothetical protein
MGRCFVRSPVACPLLKMIDLLRRTGIVAGAELTDHELVSSSSSFHLQ